MLAPEGWDVTTESVVSEIVAGMSARTSFFILMVASSVSFASSDFSTRPPDSSLIPFICFSCLLRRSFCRGPFIRSPVLVPLPLRPRSSYPRHPAASSSCSRRLDSFLLSWRERLNSLRSLFTPDSLSSFLGLVVATSRPPTAETVIAEMRVSHSCLRLGPFVLVTRQRRIFLMK